jgi:adenosylcobinamide-GDP ribazoletransferase
MRQRSSLIGDFYVCLGFFTRLPCPSTALGAGAGSLANFSSAIRMLPLAGAAAGAVAAVAMGAASLSGLPPAVAAPLAICALVAASGAMHEDGLADCADGFFGGTTPEHKLEIMRDSRIGAYGAIALMLALYLRAASLTVILAQSLALAAAVLTAAAGLSRTAALMPLALLPAARQNGAGFAAGRPESRALATAACSAFLLALSPALAGSSLTRAAAAIAFGAGAAYAVVAFAKRQIGGQTGDVAGAAQQLSEIAYYLVFASQI